MRDSCRSLFDISVILVATMRMAPGSRVDLGRSFNSGRRAGT